MSAPAHAVGLEETPASYAEDTGSAERIESGEYLRTYSQEIAAAACFLYNGVDVDLSTELLTEAREGFDLHLDALMNGNEDLGIIGGERRRKTFVKLQAIGEKWTPMAEAVDRLLETHDDPMSIATIKSENVVLLDMTDILVSDLEGQYADPAELLQVDVLMLEVVGRQAMMTQKIAKNACKIWSGNDSAEVRDDLTESVSIYEVSLNALLHGMPEVGLLPAPTEEIASGLSHLLADWSQIRPTVDSVMNGNVERDELISLFRHMADEMHKLEELAHKYVVFSKHEY
jgi:hypothetical protein